MLNGLDKSSITALGYTLLGFVWETWGLQASPTTSKGLVVRIYIYIQFL